MKIIKYRKFHFFLLLLLSTSVYGQISVDEQRRLEFLRQMEENRRQTESFSRLRNISEGAVPGINYVLDGRFFPAPLPSPSEKDRKAIAVDNDLLTVHKDFLRQKKTGIFRLHDSSKCIEETYVVSVNSDCPNAYPGKATSYSFRTKGYQWKTLSDIFLKESSLHLKGYYELGIITSLGDQPLENFNLLSDGVKQLSELQPLQTTEDFQKYSSIISKGAQVGNHVFSNKINLKANQTYLVRVIAFKAATSQSDYRISSIWGNDKRDDVILVFRTIRENSDKSWIILWKELARKDSPKI